jgi:hypothetical protein
MRRAGDVEPRDPGADPQPGCLLLQPHSPPGRHFGRPLLPGRRRRLVPIFLNFKPSRPPFALAKNFGHNKLSIVCLGRGEGLLLLLFCLFKFLFLSPCYGGN